MNNRPTPVSGGGTLCRWRSTLYLTSLLAAAACLSGGWPRAGREQPPRYYAHQAVLDKNGVIAPWYQGMNGQVDWRVRIAAETLKRYPWTDRPMHAPHYVFNGTWRVSADGEITIPPLTDWDNGDLGQRAAYVLTGLVDYYRYTGDAAALAHLWYTAEALRRYCLTPADHPWPRILISVPTRGTPYGVADPRGMIQLDIVAEVGIGLVRAYQVVGKPEWWELAKHWADLLAAKRRDDPGLSPWPRYANPEDVAWEDLQTGGVVFILEFLDEVIRLGYTGTNNALVEAREAGRRYLRDVLLPRWTEDDTWGRNYWDWNNPVQAENVTEFVARYLMRHPGVFPNWRNDVRNILTLFLNRTSVDPGSGGGLFSGAWAYPESSSCCGRSLWYGPLELAPVYAELGVRTGDPWAVEMARRQIILATYDGHETGVVEDNIDGGPIVADAWFKIAHPMALKHTLNAIAWLPEMFGAPGENHIVRTSHVVRSVTYGDGDVRYETFPASGPVTDVLRLSFRPERVEADGQSLAIREAPVTRGVHLRRLKSGDWLVTIRRDGTTRVRIVGPDPQREVPVTSGNLRLQFAGNQVRVLGRVGPDGGRAEVWLDGERQRVLIDTWSPVERARQVLYYRNALSNGPHLLEVKPVADRNPHSRGSRLHLAAVQWSRSSARSVPEPAPSWKPAAQRVIFGYPHRTDYVSSTGHRWKPATEWTVRLGAGADVVARAWYTRPTRATILGTPDHELYRYGAHAGELAAYFTVASGLYAVRIHLMEARRVPADHRLMNIRINGQDVVTRLDVAASAGGFYRALPLVFNGVRPLQGVIEVRFRGVGNAEAVVRAIELVPGVLPPGPEPITLTDSSKRDNLLTNGDFEETAQGHVGRLGHRVHAAGWTYVFASLSQSYIWAESDYVRHPECGLPEIHSGRQALRTHTDGDGRTMIYQEVDAEPDTWYEAAVRVRAVDLHGRGFGRHAGDVARLVVHELDGQGSVLAEHAHEGIREAGAYRRLDLRFHTGRSAHRLRFILDTSQHAPYTESHVTYDACVLRRLEGAP